MRIVLDFDPITGQIKVQSDTPLQPEHAIKILQNASWDLLLSSLASKEEKRIISSNGVKIN